MANFNIRSYEPPAPAINLPTLQPFPIRDHGGTIKNNTSPTAAVTSIAALTAFATVTVNVTHTLYGATGLRFVLLEVLFASGKKDVVYDGAFGPNYSGVSGVCAVASITNGNSYTFVRDYGWPETPLTVFWTVLDIDGNMVSSSQAYTDTPATIVPQVTTFVPIVGATVPYTQTFSFHVTDDKGTFRRIFVAALIADGSYEVVYDGTAFSPNYITNSTKTVIASGFAFVIDRDNGWFAGALTLLIDPIDQDGNEAVTTTFGYTIQAGQPAQSGGGLMGGELAGTPVSYSVFKTLATAGGGATKVFWWQLYGPGTGYRMYVSDRTLIVTAEVHDAANIADFEANLKSGGNGVTTDTDGFTLAYLAKLSLP